MLKPNLQFFADSTEETTAADTTTETTTETTATDESKETTTETDTKAEAQKIADAMLAKKMKGMPTKEELKAYKEWQESQKTEEQKINDRIASAESEKAKAETEANALKAQVSCLKQNVKADNIDDVIVLAQRLVTEDVSIDDAIKQVVSKYPQFASNATPDTKPNITTGAQTTQTTTTDEQALRKAMGLK